METAVDPVRLAIEDAPELARLEARCFPDAWDEATFTAALTRSIFVAYGLREQGALVAYLTAQVVTPDLEILNIAVVPEKRGRRLGTRLLGHVLRTADKLGINHGYLEVRAGNIPAKRLYARYGFAVVGVRKRYYSDTGEDALVMVRQAAGPGSTTI